jgi:hypothetical protein
VVHRKADQHHPLGRGLLRDPRLHCRAEGEAGQHRARGLQVREHGEQIVHFAAPAVVRALACADAAEVRPPGNVAQFHERARQRLHDLVVERAAVQGMRMGDQRQAAKRSSVPARRSLGLVHRALQLAGRALDQYAPRAGVHPARGLSCVAAT